MGGTIDTEDVDCWLREKEEKKLLRDAEARIRQLERLNAQLAAQIDRMRPVVSAAWGWRLSEGAPARAVVLGEAVDTYQQAMAQLAKEGR